MAIRGSQVAVLSLVVLFAACDSPARVKPWRHAPDPVEEAARAPSSPILDPNLDPEETEIRAARGHTLRIHVDTEWGRLTPIVSPSTWARRITLGTIFEPLLRYLPPEKGTDGPGRFAPRLARSWRVMPSGLEIRIELEPDVTFHDGKPLTTSDVQFTLDAIRDPRKGIDHLRAMLDDVDAIELITSHEVRLRLKRPSGWVLRALAEIPIMPMHVYDGSLIAGGALVGSGPWKLASNKAGVVHLVRYDKYWAGPVGIADVEFVYQPDSAAALISAKRGEFDIIPALIPEHYQQATAPGIAASFDRLALNPPRMRYLAFNVQRPPLDDPRVRHALALLVDRRSIAKRAFEGLVRPVLWPIWPGGPIDSKEGTIPDFDFVAAGKLLDEAGWVDTDKDGNRDKDGKQLRFVMIGSEKPAPKDASDPPVKLPRDYFIEAARRAGVVIEVKTGGEAWLEKKLAERYEPKNGFDIIEIAWGGMADMDLTALSSTKDPVSGKLVPVTPRIGRALDALGASWDPGERAKVAPELADAFAEAWPFAGVVADAPQGLVQHRLANVKIWDGWIDLSQVTFK